MLNLWNEKYQNSAQNSEIAASATHDFAVDQIDTEHKQLHGSMNSLEIVNHSNYAVKLTLDGNDQILIGSYGTYIIEAKDGRGFDMIRLTNQDSSNAIPANTILVRWGRSEVS